MLESNTNLLTYIIQYSTVDWAFYNENNIGSMLIIFNILLYKIYIFLKSNNIHST